MLERAYVNFRKFFSGKCPLVFPDCIAVYWVHGKRFFKTLHAAHVADSLSKGVCRCESEVTASGRLNQRFQSM